MRSRLWVRSLARRVLWSRPRLYRFFEPLRDRKKLPHPNYEVLIEGFPRSGNTYTEMMFRLTQGERFELCHHTHHPVTVIEAVRTHRKTILVLRNPDDAVLSWCISWGGADLASIANIFDIYINYHQALLPAVSGMAVFEFKELTTNFRGLLQQLSDFWQCPLQVDFDEKAMSERAFQMIDERIVSEDGQLTEIRVNRPSAERAIARPQMMQLIASPELARLRQQAQQVYQQVIGITRLKWPRTAEKRRCLLSIVPDDDFGLGHLNGYHRALGEACRRNRWAHVITCPSTNGVMFEGLSVLPLLETWSSVRRSSEWVRWLQFFRLTRSIIRSAELIVTRSQDTQLLMFIESFTVRKLLATVLAAVVTSGDTELWVLLRYGYEGKDTERRFIEYVCKFYRLVRPGKLRLFSDSRLVASRLEPGLKQVITVLPIPTANAGGVKPESEVAAGVIRAIWPGSPVPTKGTRVVRRLLHTPNSTHLQVVLCCKAHPDVYAVPGGPLLKTLPEQITHADHLALLAEADAVLLPYDAQSYASRTSGLLVEAIVCGTMPFVSGPSWLSNEMEQLGLPELVVDWARADIWTYIEWCLKDNAVQQRFALARRKYQNFHCLEAYAKILNGDQSGRL